MYKFERSTNKIYTLCLRILSMLDHSVSYLSFARSSGSTERKGFCTRYMAIWPAPHCSSKLKSSISSTSIKAAHDMSNVRDGMASPVECR